MKYIFPICLIGLIVTASSCKKEDPDPTPEETGYTIPTTYAFTNVDHTGQTQRIAMLDELSSYMNTGKISGTVLDAQKMKDMYANAGNPFSDATLNGSGKQLKNKTYAADQSLFDSYFDNLALASQSTVAGSNGVAGVVASSSDASKTYLLDANGIEYNQLIRKGLMGAIFYYQATSYYLENIVTDDNNTVTSGEGTAMEHHWDEAFGYFGVPVDFPTNTSDAAYWGSYSNQRDAVLGSNKTMMDAFLKGRAAISNKDYTSRDEAVTTLREMWERICVGSAIHYLNSVKLNLANDGVRCHELSECLGFIYSLKYNVDRKITDSQITDVLNHIGTNLYNVTATDLDNARDLLSTIYGLDDIKNIL
ncbi:MAG: DUF4856 domain-containing protein [Flavobacteriales bacterium]|nr:DUF4856 domain-containing protein [Flavobacteriales bacterium]